MDGWMCWMGRRRQGLEECVPLPYSPPSSACRLVPETPVAPYARRARIPAQEFGRWTSSPSRNSIVRLKSTPLCDIALLPLLARTHCCSSRRRGPYRYVFTHARIPAQEFDSRYPRNLSLALLSATSPVQALDDDAGHGGHQQVVKDWGWDCGRNLVSNTMRARRALTNH